MSLKKYFTENGATIPGVLGGEPSPLLTTEKPTTPRTKTSGCFQNGNYFADGASIDSEDPCEHCYCMKGDIVCAVEPCMGGMDAGADSNCVAQPPPEGSCCPTEYKCGKQHYALPLS